MCSASRWPCIGWRPHVRLQPPRVPQVLAGLAEAATTKDELLLMLNAKTGEPLWVMCASKCGGGAVSRDSVACECVAAAAHCLPARSRTQRQLRRVRDVGV